ncbi:hypothetical protein ACPW96_00740 [Micromonospora sp. DT81.3]|uniref:hypothetical protein n=1 Tax=Actinomycetes TaxID=1760 RepID=UPI003CE75DFC
MPGKFNLDVATIGQILDDPQAKAIVDDVVPGMSDNPMVSMVRGMSASSVLAMAGSQVDGAKVAELRERLSAL